MMGMVGMVLVGGVTVIMIIRLIAPGVEVWTQWQMVRSITGTHVCRCVHSVCVIISF